MIYERQADVEEKKGVVSLVLKANLKAPVLQTNYKGSMMIIIEKGARSSDTFPQNPQSQNILYFYFTISRPKLSWTCTSLELIHLRKKLF